MDVAEASLIVFSVWVISAFFFALILGRWFEMANDEAGGLGDLDGARSVNIGATKPMRPISRRDR